MNLIGRVLLVSAILWIGTGLLFNADTKSKEVSQEYSRLNTKLKIGKYLPTDLSEQNSRIVTLVAGASLIAASLQVVMNMKGGRMFLSLLIAFMILVVYNPALSEPQNALLNTFTVMKLFSIFGATLL